MQVLVSRKILLNIRRKVITPLAFAIALGAFSFADQAQAQDKKKPAQPAQRKDKKEKPPAPVNLTIDTKDGVKLRCTFFGRPKSEKGDVGKSVIPFILLHDWEGNRQQLLQYGSYLQSQGHAAIVPDFRGHGESVNVAGRDKEISFEKFRKADIPSAMFDIEACKKFLVKKHNQELVNIDLLSIVAVGESSVLALNWVWSDWWDFPPVNAQGIKQGQDVKALMLVSPKKKLSGVAMADRMKHPMFTGVAGGGMPLLILWGTEDKEAAKDSERIHAMLKKSRPDISKIEDRDERYARTSLFGQPIEGSSLTGVELMATPVVNRLWPYTENFFAKKVGGRAKEWVWKTREVQEEEDE
ncbi:MAG: alpha/beta hydrolase [Mariniblastus sp.]